MIEVKQGMQTVKQDKQHNNIHLSATVCSRTVGKSYVTIHENVIEKTTQSCYLFLISTTNVNYRPLADCNVLYFNVILYNPHAYLSLITYYVKHTLCSKS